MDFYLFQKNWKILTTMCSVGADKGLGHDGFTAPKIDKILSTMHH